MRAFVVMLDARVSSKAEKEEREKTNERERVEATANLPAANVALSIAAANLQDRGREGERGKKVGVEGEGGDGYGFDLGEGGYPLPNACICSHARCQRIIRGREGRERAKTNERERVEAATNWPAADVALSVAAANLPLMWMMADMAMKIDGGRV